MHYTDHAIISARKFNCREADTLALHKLMDSSKLYYPHFMHRMFSHNLWFVSVVVSLVGDTVPNTKTGGDIPTRDILLEHLKEDHDGHTPSLENWIEQIRMSLTPSRWINKPQRHELAWLRIKKRQDAGVTPPRESLPDFVIACIDEPQPYIPENEHTTH